MTDFKTSETAKNLMRAFAGESQARNRYTFAAGLAKEQKMPMVEAVFRYTADQEKEHAEIFYDYLKPLDKEAIFIDGGYPVDLEKNTLAQLNAAAHNEYEEHDVVYKSFGDIAQKEGFSQIAATFRMIAEGGCNLGKAFLLRNVSKGFVHHVMLLVFVVCGRIQLGQGILFQIHRITSVYEYGFLI